MHVTRGSDMTNQRHCLHTAARCPPGLPTAGPCAAVVADRSSAGDGGCLTTQSNVLQSDSPFRQPAEQAGARGAVIAQPSPTLPLPSISPAGVWENERRELTPGPSLPPHTHTPCEIEPIDSTSPCYAGQQEKVRCGAQHLPTHTVESMHIRHVTRQTCATGHSHTHQAHSPGHEFTPRWPAIACNPSPPDGTLASPSSTLPLIVSQPQCFKMHDRSQDQSTWAGVRSGAAVHNAFIQRTAALTQLR